MNDKPKLDIEAILQRLPHRYPFLLVDRVLEAVPGDTLVALKNVTFNEPFFMGHFPGVPVMPGVLMIEAMAQAGGLLVWEGASDEEREAILYLTGVEKARFKLPVRPGDQLILKVRLVQSRSNVWRFDSRAEVDGRLAAKAEITMIAGKQS
ncbi:MAG: 3-hydroxyacyl-ACP dehydratase FabZ [Gammaproteobacteria bacterium]|nr:3-hydroxyacyl-ACP dehydratase FabZ [Gammaproteobacteria bacterium]